MKTSLSSKGRIMLPAKLRKLDRLVPGEQFSVERMEEGSYRLIRILSPPNSGVVDWLLACPAKGYFEPIESESTGEIRYAARSGRAGGCGAVLKGKRERNGA